MKCPRCGVAETKVIESRMNQVGDNIRRRRECISCENRFTTHERIEVAMPMIIKKDGRREPYNREKILGGVTKACQKRPITTEQIERLVEDMEKKVASLNAKEIPSRTIGHLVMATLHELDKVAYIRFASVYREFRDVEEFVSELREWPQEQDESIDQEKLDL
jgi:transcriptional repressor NrdR